MPESIADVRSEFDRLSALPESWDFHYLYHPFVLSCLPAHVDSLLDVGCGTGAFTRRVASRCAEVVAIDLSPGMIQHARQLATPPNVRYSVASLFDASVAPASFDAVVSIAALYHMPLEPALTCLGSLLKPGGTLIILDFFAPSNLSDRLVWWLGTTLSPPMRLLRSGRLFRSQTVRAAWARHEVHDRYFTLPQMRFAARTLLPGATVRRHLFRRFSVTWNRAA